MPSIDILMVTHRSPDRTRFALSRLLEVCDETMRVWLWHNGNHEETLELVRSMATHPRVHRFHHSHENQKLWAPMNWLFREATGDFVSKVDDDNVVPRGWPGPLLAAHLDYYLFGALGSWRFQEEDFIPELARKKIREFPGGHRLLQNPWVEGSCFLMKRGCVEQQGSLEPGQSFPQYCLQLALRGWVHGWYYPFVQYENLDDPRSPHSMIRTDEDLRHRLPLMAQYNGVTTVRDWTEQIKRSARVAQTAPIDPRHWQGWRRDVRRTWKRIQRIFGQRRRW